MITSLSFTPSSNRYTVDVGSFNPVDEWSISWLKANEEIIGLSRRVEGQPSEGLPIVGFDIDFEPLMHPINEAIVIGDPIQFTGKCLVHVNRLNRSIHGNTIQVRRADHEKNIEVLFSRKGWQNISVLRTDNLPIP